MLPIRLKIALASTLATVILLGGAGLIFLTTLHSGLQNSLDNSLRSRSDELAAEVNSDGTVRSDLTSGRITLGDNTYGQVLGSDGAVLQSVDELQHSLLSAQQLAEAKSGARFFDVLVNSTHGGHHQEVRVLAAPVGSGGTVVAVGLSRDIVDEAVERAGKQLLLLGFIVLLIAAPGSWFLAGSALAPVERMRRQAAELQANDAGGGLTVPETRDEIGRLATTMNALLARLHDALERERAFVADAGHELRTPLTVLRGELELAQRPGRSNEELLATVEVAAEETERLIRLAEDLLVLARDEDSANLRLTRFDLVETLADATALFDALALKRSVEIELDAPAALAVTADPDRIRRAVENLISNALRYAPAGSRVIVRAARAGDEVRIAVLDEGPGFPPELIPVVFERFRRGDVARTRGGVDDSEQGGSGLGLAIVRNIMRSHGGDAEAANRNPGPGAQVTLHWPVTDA
ncbi:hypothetical protein SAMN05892883_2129 [Jatrophihabitans sp. GAS493]|uniref:sensor histidine kinase n=1 Tax=Jatrophihabitans sp. GAS493 TaxID=1907575 RepID=UPI000BB7F311|nr:ATP-binding protein [Jatrophihabitans sp. GAS493]SOD72792.1 hypothetical protein SAMN05892883_2129 [Jatrophihabitans sp. GAS493]